MTKKVSIAFILLPAAWAVFTTCGSTPPPRGSRIKTASYEQAKLGGQVAARLAARWKASDGTEMVFGPPDGKNRGQFRRFNGVLEYSDLSRAIFRGTYLILAEDPATNSITIRLEFKSKHAVNADIQERRDFSEQQITLRGSRSLVMTQAHSNFSEDNEGIKFSKPIVTNYKRLGGFRGSDLTSLPAVPAKFKIPAARNSRYRGSCKLGALCIDVFSPPGNPAKKEAAAGLIMLVILGQNGCVSIGTKTSGRRCDRRRANAMCRGGTFRPNGSPEGTQVQVTYVFHDVTAKIKSKLAANCKKPPTSTRLIMR